MDLQNNLKTICIWLHCSWLKMNMHKVINKMDFTNLYTSFQLSLARFIIRLRNDSIGFTHKILQTFRLISSQDKEYIIVVGLLSLYLIIMTFFFLYYKKKYLDRKEEVKFLDKIWQNQTKLLENLKNDAMRNRDCINFYMDALDKYKIVISERDNEIVKLTNHIDLLTDKLKNFNSQTITNMFENVFENMPLKGCEEMVSELRKLADHLNIKVNLHRPKDCFTRRKQPYRAAAPKSNVFREVSSGTEDI